MWPVGDKYRFMMVIQEVWRSIASVVETNNRSLMGEHFIDALKKKPNFAKVVQQG
jgi:hypothetical protein